MHTRAWWSFRSASVFAIEIDFFLSANVGKTPLELISIRWWWWRWKNEYVTHFISLHPNNNFVLRCMICQRFHRYHGSSHRNVFALAMRTTFDEHSKSHSTRDSRTHSFYPRSVVIWLFQCLSIRYSAENSFFRQVNKRLSIMGCILSGRKHFSSMVASETMMKPNKQTHTPRAQAFHDNYFCWFD